MIRKAELEDLDGVMECIEDARKLLRESGSKQWNDKDGYPTRIDLERDILNNNCYISVKYNYDLDQEEIAGTVTYEGHEKEYDVVYGKWLTDTTNYTTIHRLATRTKYRMTGVAKKLMEYAVEYSKKTGRESVRIDTHPKNSTVRHLAEVLEYTECGYVLYSRIKNDEAKRLVFEKKVK